MQLRRNSGCRCTPSASAKPWTICSNSTPKLFRKIRNGEYAFEDEGWSDVSVDAKDLVSKMLTVNPRRRFSAHEDHVFLARATSDSTGIADVDMSLSPHGRAGATGCGRRASCHSDVSSSSSCDTSSASSDSTVCRQRSSETLDSTILSTGSLDSTMHADLSLQGRSPRSGPRRVVARSDFVPYEPSQTRIVTISSAKQAEERDFDKQSQDGCSVGLKQWLLSSRSRPRVKK